MNGVSATIVPLPTMEANKDFELVFELARRMEEFKLNRWDSFRFQASARVFDSPAVQHVPAATPYGHMSQNYSLCAHLACLPVLHPSPGCHLCRRKEPIIAIGGGVCLDVCGLAANLYRRNTPVIKVPTSIHCSP